MGKQLWKKPSIRVGKLDPGCIWTVFRSQFLDYHPWENVKRIIKHKFRKTTKTATNTSPFGAGSSPRKSKSIKARIKALLVLPTNVTRESRKVTSIDQEHDHELLISLINSNQKLLTTINPSTESPNLTRVKGTTGSKEEYVSVLELFEVDRDLLFLEASRNINSPPRRKKHIFVKSGSFPNSFGKTSGKLEYFKYNEVWSQNVEIRKSRSQNVERSSSLNESVDNRDALVINKNLLSTSSRFTNDEKSNIEILSECTQDLAEPNINNHGVEIEEIVDDRNFEENNKGLFSVSLRQIENSEYYSNNVVEDSLTVSPENTFDIDCNESLQYVKFVLNIVDFTTTYSVNQPLDSALFDDIEIFYSFQPESSFERKILFDLLNEALLDIKENSRRNMKNNCVVERVWEFIREYLLWKSELLDQDFADVIVRELSRQKNGWCNLQRDIEFVAIDLEDWIFDELLFEIVL